MLRKSTQLNYGSRTSIYAHTPPGHEWNKIDDVVGPCDDRAGLVNALFFFGTAERKLFVGYAEEGWSIWKHGANPDLQHFSWVDFPSICRVGQARLAPDQQSVLISTLDQSIVTYSMSDRGPIPDTRKAFPLQVPVYASPILPVAHTSMDIILGGTSGGDVPIVQSGSAAVPRLHQGDGHLIRCITPHGSNIIVGSTGPNDEVVLKCFSLVGWKGRGLWGHKQATGAAFCVTLSDVLVTPNEAQKRTAPPIKNECILSQLVRSGEFKFGILVLSILTMLVLSSGPPGGTPYQVLQKAESTQTGVVKTTTDRYQLWIEFGVKHLIGYARRQVYSWCFWVWSVISGCLWQFVSIPVAIVKLLRAALAQWICERFEIYKALGICPEVIPTKETM